MSSHRQTNQAHRAIGTRNPPELRPGAPWSSGHIERKFIDHHIKRPPSWPRLSEQNGTGRRELRCGDLARGGPDHRHHPGRDRQPTWSAHRATAQGAALYKSKGFKTTRTVLNGLGHHDYNMATLMDAGK